MTERFNGWGKVLVAVLPLALGGVISVSKLSERVDGQARLQDSQYETILRELQNINGRLDRMEK